MKENLISLVDSSYQHNDLLGSLCTIYLVLNRYPLGCRNCRKTWINEITGHRIICQCKCKHNMTLAHVSKPRANVIERITP